MQSYIEDKMGIEPIGCCRVGHQKLTPDEQTKHFAKHCEQIQTEKVVCYCKFCTDAINQGGKNGIHIWELLFPDNYV